MFFVRHPQILHKHCLQFLLGVKWPQEKLKTMLMQNLGVTNKEHYGMLWYFLERSTGSCLCSIYKLFQVTRVQLSQQSLTFSSRAYSLVYRPSRAWLSLICKEK